MKRSRNPTRAEWDAIVEEGPGVRMWKGQLTLFYDGKILYDFENEEPLVYSKEERLKWKVIVVLPGVEVIPEDTFFDCRNTKTVILSDTVRRIEGGVFRFCFSLEYARLSRNLEFIGELAFCRCWPLTSIFIPPSCTVIERCAFYGCQKLSIFHVPQHTQLSDDRVISETALIRASPFHTDAIGYYDFNEVHEWIKNINANTDEYALHQACSAFNPPLNDMILAMMKRQGLSGLGAWRDGAWRKPNAIGVTPLQYLEANPYAEIDEQEIVRKYILEMMGEVVE